MRCAENYFPLSRSGLNTVQTTVKDFKMCWDCETLAKQFSRKIRLSRQTPGYVLIREFLLSAWCLVAGAWWCLWNTNVIYYTACPQLSCLCENFWREKLLMASIIEIISQHYVTLPKLNETNTERIAALWETGIVVTYWKIITIRYFEIFCSPNKSQRVRDWHGQVNKSGLVALHV